MDAVNKTLYIPLYGKALVSRRGILLHDPRAEAIWEKEGFALRGKAASKWLAIYMAMRASVFDRWTAEKLKEMPEALVLHIGCGLDSRCERLDNRTHRWYDIDFPEVIRERRKYFSETEYYRMIEADMRQDAWREQIPAGEDAVIVMEGVSMYLRPEELSALLRSLKSHFRSVQILMDCYSSFAAKASRYKNPINEVGVTTVYGLEDPRALATEAGLTFAAEHDQTPTRLIGQLDPGERIVFSGLYAGRLARRLYRLYEFK